MKLTVEQREAVIALAELAAAAILDVYAEDFTVEHKADASPLTRADLASHRIIVDGLQKLTPQWPVLSEEAADIPWLTRQKWNTYWLVDPLDGTREFVKRNDEFSVNIALIHEHESVVGVVQQPTTGELWFGAKGEGAFKRAHCGDVNRPLRTRHAPERPLHVAASRSHRDPRTQAMLEKMGDIAIVALGSSLKFCRIAEGTLDVYPRFGPTSEWDTAAGQCVLEAAGGALFAPSGKPFRYNLHDSLLNGDFIALGDAGLPWQDWL